MIVTAIVKSYQMIGKTTSQASLVLGQQHKERKCILGRSLPLSFIFYVHASRHLHDKKVTR